MSYIGNQPPDIGAYDVESFDGGGTSFTLKRAATVSSVLLFIDGVRQTPTDAYTVSGVTLTTTATTPSGTDNVTVMFMGDVVDIGAPSADTVSTAKIQDDAVTAAKLANSINTEIAANTAKTGITSGQATAITANTAKVTNATHTGDVTGATALTIAVDAVDIAMLSATGTASSSTFLRGDNAWASAGGLSDASMWVLTTSLTGVQDVDITTNLAVYSGDGYGSLGSAMTESSGIFTFPSTGYWQITFRAMNHKALSDSYSLSAAIYTTINDSSYGLATKGRAGNWGSGGVQYAAPTSTFLFDVTDVANCKVKFHIEDANTSDTLIGSTAYIATGFEFMRLGDT